MRALQGYSWAFGSHCRMHPTTRAVPFARNLPRAFLSAAHEDGEEDTPEDNAEDNAEEEEATILVEEEECFDLCDIDWDQMPGFQEEDEEEEESKPETASAEPLDSETARFRLEMSWEVRQNEEDCDLEDVSTCGDFCPDCAGRGSVRCRFCGGSTKLMMQDRVTSCPVCNPKGDEICKSCKGSGRIAPWTKLTK